MLSSHVQALMARDGLTALARPRAAKRRRLDLSNDAGEPVELDYAAEVDAATKYAAELEHAYVYFSGALVSENSD